ncbi:MAG: carbohydrate binding family 9 domain-containing protein, partial [Bacteroidales bacterium]|nr:carbohydrate binding family 9 domain-containing protein [Bacteroidales bacterium]
MRSTLPVFLVCLFACAQSLFGQSTPINRDSYRLQAKKTDQPIVVDGVLDEAIWSRAEKTTPFYRILPIDTGFAQSQSEVMIAYDETNMYMGIICHDTMPGKRPAESLRRDFSFPKNDNFIAFIDTYNDQTNGFAFGVNAVGGQWDGMQADGGKVANDWDGKWYSAVQNYEDRWVAEFKIPFRTIRFHEGDTEWGINFSRLDLKTNEKSAWAPVPRQFASATLAFTGTLSLEKPLPKSGVRVSLIPYVSGKATKDKESGDPAAYKANAGLDAKVILSTSMNLDVTINPDYSQVEVDQQVTNLDRFELYFPEKRKFFLENSDLFANLGTENLRPFFSRRIGLDQPVIAGARLSGSAGENWRIGLMNMQTAGTAEHSADNFAVAVLQRKVLSRSNVGAFLTNKQVITSPDDSASYFDYNRVAGGEFNFASVDNNWTGKALYHYSFNPGEEGNRFATTGMIAYNTETFSAGWSQAYVGANYLAEMGYVRRNAYHQSKPMVGYKFYTMSERVVNHGPELEADFIFDPNFNLTDREIDLSYSLTWRDRSTISLGVENGYVMLLEPFDPTHTGGVEIPAGSEFNWNEVSLMYMSTMKRLFTFMVGTRYGGFYGGTRASVEAEINYRIQPYGSLSLVAAYNKVEMPDPYTSMDLVLVGPKLDITFTEKLFFTTFVQYNNQIDNINVN